MDVIARDAAIKVLADNLREGMPPLGPDDMAVALVYLLERAGLEIVHADRDDRGAVEALRDLWNAVEALPESLPVEQRAALAVRVLTLVDPDGGQ